MFIADLHEPIHHLIDAGLVSLQRGQRKGIGNHLSVLAMRCFVSDAHETSLDAWLAERNICWTLKA